MAVRFRLVRVVATRGTLQALEVADRMAGNLGNTMHFPASQETQ